jgi:WD40 repeat protein
MSAFPYPGLRAFRRDEADIFFGRDEQVDQLLEKLRTSRFLAVIGASGCGKSSLVKAGMIAALETGFLASAGTRWRIAEMRPGNRPLHNLSEALIHHTALGYQTSKELDMAFLYATLKRGPLGLVEVLQERALPDRTSLLLLVDQFEEIFRYARTGGMDEADAFVALLLATAKHDVPVYVVITMRSDFLGDCALFMGLPEALNQSQFLTPRLTRDQRAEAIIGPASVFGDKVEPALLNHLLNDMGGGPDQLPLMQHVLMRMWTRANQSSLPHPMPVSSRGALLTSARERTISLSLEDYQGVGGLSGALSSHADKAFDELSDAQQCIAKVLFRCLSERGTDKRDTRCPMRLGTVAEVADVSCEDLAEVVEVFRRPSRSFITPSVETPLNADTILDIGHESLIRQWTRMNEWVEQEVNSATTYRRLEETARLWKSGNAALWGPPDLDIALDWKKREKPSAAWAARYGGNFDLAMGFLESSENKRRADDAASEALRQRELAQARAFAEEQEARAEAQRQRAEEQKLRAEAERQRAEEQVKTARRLRVVASVLAVMFLLSIGAVIFARNERDKATAEQRRTFSRELANVAVDNLNVNQERSLLLALHALSLTHPVDEDDVAREVKEALHQAVASRIQVTLADPKDGHKAGVIGIAFSPDGTRIATASDDKTAKIWDAGTGRVLLSKEHTAPLSAVAFSPDGTQVATASVDKTIIWNAHTGDVLPTVLGHTAPISGVTFSPNGKLLATASWDKTTKVWDTMAGGNPVWVFQADAPVSGIAFSPDGTVLATASEDVTTRDERLRFLSPLARLMIWDVRTGRLVSSLTKLPGLISGLAFSPDGTRLATASEDKAMIRDAGTGEVLLPPLTGHTAPISGLAFHPDGTLLGTAGTDKTVKIWRVSDGELVHTFTSHTGPVRGLAFSLDGTRLATASSDSTAKIWDISRRHVASVRSVVFSPDGTRLATASWDKTAKIWDAIFNQRLHDLKEHDKGVNGASFSPDGTRLATASLDGTAKLWDVQTGTVVKTIPGHSGCATPKAASTSDRLVHPADRDTPLLGIAFSPDGARVATARGDGTAEIWDVGTAQKVQTLRGHVECKPVTSVAFSPDGTHLATASRDGTVRLWDANSGQGKIIFNESYGVNGIVFSPDGTQLATASGDGTVRVLKVPSGEESKAFTHSSTGTVHAVTFSPDGTLLASGSQDGTVKIWKLGSPYERPLTIKGRTAAVMSVTFSPDGRRLATASEDGDVQVHWLDIQALKDLTRSRVKRSLTENECKTYVNVQINIHPCPYPEYSLIPSRADSL